MSDPDSKDNKWTCEYCTYENFPSAIKCTMCKGAKPLLNEDIFRLSPPQTAFDGEEERGAVADIVEPSSYNASFNTINASTNTSTTSTNTTTNPPNPTTTQKRQEILSLATTDALALNKWACKLCTYLNWPRALRCVQCYSKRGANTIDHELGATAASTSCAYTQTQPESPRSCTPSADGQESTDAGSGGSISRAQKKLRDLRLISGSDSELNACNLMHTNKSHDACVGATSNRLSPFEQSPSTNTLLNNMANATHNLQQQQHSLSSTNLQHTYVQKWACNTCTYENWPKSLKCSMCGEPKDTNASSMSSGATSICDANAAGAPGEQGGHRFPHDRDHGSNRESANNTLNNKHIYQLGSSETINNCDNMQERQERRQRQIRRQVDWQWLNACLGVVDNNYSAVEAYLSCGGNPTRSLTSTEIAALNRNSAFDVGHTLIHLAIRFHREEMLPMLLAQISGSGPGIKRVPSYVAPDLASDIRRHFANTLRVRKSVFNCHFVQEHATFALPADIEELPIPIQEQLYEELLDRDAQKQLESSPPALNWSLEITARLGSRLLVLWNRSAGDCLLDSAMQATWGVFDRDNILRRALSDTLHQCGAMFYPRWKEYEMLQASHLNYTLEETQWEADWRTLLRLATQPGASLEQLHIFALAHILRRPIVVYGVKYVKSFRGEDIGYARFEGLYLPLLWDQNFCIKSPIALGYTRGHFSALVPMEPFNRIDVRREDQEDVTYLPLMDCESKLLPIHFLPSADIGREEVVMRQWLDVCVTEGGLLVAQQKLRKRPLLVAQMLEEWLNHYRRIAQVITAPFVRRPQQANYSSDGDSDEE